MDVVVDTQCSFARFLSRVNFAPLRSLFAVHDILRNSPLCINQTATEIKQRTLEVLETNGVPVYGWQTDEFPAFFSPTSGVKCPERVDSPDEVAQAYHIARALNLPHGCLVGVPNKDPASGASVEAAIQSALQAAEEQGITGPATTPFVLKFVADTTKGDSLKSNISLVKQNAKVGGAIAKSIAETTLFPSKTV